MSLTRPRRLFRQHAGQVDPAVDIDFFGALGEIPSVVEFEAREVIGIEQIPEAPTQGLAAMVEAAVDQGEQPLPGGFGQGLTRSGDDADDGGINFRRGPEGFGRNAGYPLKVGQRLGQDGERAIILGARRGLQAIGDLGLNRHVHPGDGRLTDQQIDDERCGHLVWKVGDQEDAATQSALSRSQGIADSRRDRMLTPQDVTGDQGEIRPIAQAVAADGLQGTVDFDGDDVARLSHEFLGERAGPRAHLEDDVVGSELGGGHQFAHQVAVDEEVLAETLQRPNAGGGENRPDLVFRLGHGCPSGYQGSAVSARGQPAYNGPRFHAGTGPGGLRPAQESTMRRSDEVLKEAVEGIGVKALAAHLKLSPALIYKWCQPHDPNDPDAGGARNPLDRLADIHEATNDPEVINWICHRAGGFFAPNPSIDGRAFEAELLVGTQRLVKEFSDMLEEVSRSVANDGRIEADEAGRIRRHWETLKRVAETFVTAAELGKFRKGSPGGR